MNIARDYNQQPDGKTMIYDGMDDVERESLELRISFLYEVIGVILLKAIKIAEKDNYPSVKRME